MSYVTPGRKNILMFFCCIIHQHGGVCHPFHGEISAKVMFLSHLFNDAALIKLIYDVFVVVMLIHRRAIVPQPCGIGKRIMVMYDRIETML